MKKNFLTGCIVFSVLMFSCQHSGETGQSKTDTVYLNQPAPAALKEKPLTAEEQKALTPDMVIQTLLEGNRRFMENDLTARDHSALVRNASAGQYPKAVVLSCLDSRVPVEDVFDKGIGDLFVARVAGNFANDDILGSMEYACKV